MNHLKPLLKNLIQPQKISKKQSVILGLALLMTGAGAIDSEPVIAQIAPASDGVGTKVNPNGNRLDISGGKTSRDGANLFHSFQRFGLSEGQIANFLSNPAIRNILGRVVGGEASIVNGLIQVSGGNSNLFLMNPAGIVFGPNAQLNVPASFTATTATGIGFNAGWFNAIADNNWAALVGTPSAFQFGVSQPGAIANFGNLSIPAGNNLTLLGGTVLNAGTLSAPGGNITIAAVPGSSNVRISQTGHLLSLDVGAGIGGLGDNSANLDGIVPLSLPQLLAGGDNHATGVQVNADGTITLTNSAMSLDVKTGDAIVSGNIDVSNRGIGGGINLIGSRVGVISANINASGETGGGVVRIGGDYQGKGNIPNALQTFISGDSTINVDAIARGNGGRAIVWADKTTAFYGNISARGGSNSGNGGFVEVSGKENLIFRGNVNLSASNGITGTLLLDPENITIVEGSSGESDSELTGNQILNGDGTGTFTISETKLESLEGNADVKLEASNDIIIADLSDNQLTFKSGMGSVIFTADADKNGVGAFSMNSTDTIRAEGRNVTINAAAINFVNIDTSSTSVNGGAITLNAASNILTGSLKSSTGGSGNGGEIALSSSQGSIDTTAGSLDSSSVDGDGGNITLTAEGDIKTGELKSASVGEIIPLGTYDEFGTEQFSTNGGSGIGGNITLESRTGAIDTTAGNLHAYSLEANGGNITISAAGDINTGELISSSSFFDRGKEQNFGSGTGSGGSIAITSSSGGIDTSSGWLNSSSGSGNGGAVSLTATGDIKTSNILSESNSGNGGNIAITSANGGIDTSSGWLSSSSYSGNGGDVSLSATGDIKTSGIRSLSYDSGSGGAIAITSANGGIDTSSGGLSSYSSSGDGGAVSLTATGNIKTSDISSSSGSSNGGAIAITSTQGGIDTSFGWLSSSSDSGNAGAVSLSATGDIKTRNIQSYSNGTGSGGAISITSTQGGIDTSSGGLESYSSSGDGGAVSLTATGDIKTSVINSSSNGSGSGGNIFLTSTQASIDTTYFNTDFLESIVKSYSSQGNGGSVRLSALGNIKTTNIWSYSNGSGSGGTIAVESTQGSVDTTSIRLLSSSTSGRGGNVILTTKDMLNVGDISSSGLLQGGNISLTSHSSNVNTASGTLDAFSEQGQAGNITIMANGGSIAFGNVSASNVSVADGGSDALSIANPDANVTSDADQINPLSGEVSLQAHNDITVNEPISTSSISLLELRAGRNININSNIDTSGSNGNIVLRGNDSGADINRRSPGAGNVTMASGTTIDAGTGNITIELGTLGEIGNIAIANLNTTGNVNINARGGSIVRSSDNALITANFAVFQTIDKGGLGTQSQPLRLNVNNLEATTGYGGAFFDSPNRGVTVGGADRSFNGISTSGGGDIALIAFGDIIVTEPIETSAFGNAGNIALTSSAGSIDTTLSSLQSYSNQGNGGAISLTATGDIQTSDIISNGEGSGSGGAIAITSTNGAIDTSYGFRLSSYGGNGGNVSLSATGDIKTSNISSYSSGTGSGGAIAIASRNGGIDTSSGRLDSYSSGTLDSYSFSGNAGAVSLSATGDIKTGNIISSSNGSGSGGAIAITSTQGGIDTTSGGLVSASSAGNAGAVSLTATGDIKTNNIGSYSTGRGSGGNISLTSSSGHITSLNNAEFEVQNALESFSESGTAGNVTVSAAGNVTIEGIRSDGDVRGGNINITSGNAINTTAGEINSYSEKGTGGNVSLWAQNDISASNINTYGDLESGDVSIISRNRSITTSAITTEAPNGTSGNITLNTFTTTGNITTTNITSSGSTNAGNILVDSAGNVTTSDVSSTSSKGSAGYVEILADGDATTGNVTTEGNTGAGNATVTAGRNASTGNVSSTSSAGTSGNATVNAVGNATTGNISSTASAGTSGNARVNAGENAATGDVTSTGNTGAGNASVTAKSTATIGNVSSISSAGTSGNATVAGSRITAGNISSVGQTGAGNATIDAGESVQIGNVLSQSQLGTSGNSLINAVGSISVGNILSIGNTGTGEVLVNSYTGSVSAGNLESISQNGHSGNVSVTARGDITAANIRSQGTTEAGNITVNSTEGAVTAGNLESLSEIGNAGNITVEAFKDVTAGDISSIGGIDSGDITVTSREGSISTGTIQTIALTGVAGEIELSAKNGITTGNLISRGVLENGRINLHNQTGQINTGEALADRGNFTVNGIPTEINPQQVSAALNIPNNLPNNNVMSAIAPNSLIEQIELARSQEFSDYLGEDIQAESMTTESLKNALSKIAEQTGIHSAIVYVSAHPDQLEMVLFTASGEPIRKTIPSASRETVIKVVSEFRDRLTNPRQRNTTSYLKSSQQLYQWLIAPIESELQAKGINTLLFSMDAGLRSIPLAALHDGKQFLVEKYSLALIPSVSLMDTRYQSLKTNPMLAMGASKFTDSQPLPAVPLELQIITQNRSSKSFLNEDFTLNNLKNQRFNYPYKIIHLATHAEFQSGELSNSYIQLWDDKLHFNQLRQLKLNSPSVELLVLSACRTAIGNEKAEMGFAGLAVLSGVKSALASVWYVSDVGTLGLMTEFYSHLNSTPIKAEALREAQLAMIRGKVQIAGGMLQTSKDSTIIPLPEAIDKNESLNLSHPYYWSGFTMIGSPW